MTTATFFPPSMNGFKFDTVQGYLWAQQVNASIQNLPGLINANQWTNTNKFWRSGNPVGNTAICLLSGFQALVDVQKLSSNAIDARGQGGNAAIYIQHLVDSSMATINNANIGIRVQLETYQTSVTGVVNDCVTGYFGLFNGGVNTGGFGYHADAYHVATGASCSTYGGSVELFRKTSAGFTVGYHVRTNYGPPGYGSYPDDFAFLASPGGSLPGSSKFHSIFSGGSIYTGTTFCDYGLDFRNASCAIAGIYMLDNVLLTWGDNISSHTRSLSAGNPGQFAFALNGSTIFSITDGGNLSFAASAVNIGGAVGSSYGYITIVVPGAGAKKIQVFN